MVELIVKFTAEVFQRAAEANEELVALAFREALDKNLFNEPLDMKLSFARYNGEYLRVYIQSGAWLIARCWHVTAPEISKLAAIAADWDSDVEAHEGAVMEAAQKGLEAPKPAFWKLYEEFEVNLSAAFDATDVSRLLKGTLLDGQKTIHP